MKNNTTKVLEGQKCDKFAKDIMTFTSFHQVKDIQVSKHTLNTNTKVVVIHAFNDQGIGVEINFFLSKNSGREE